MNEDNSILYYTVDENGNAQESKNSTTFKFKGNIQINNLPDGKYKLYETKVPNGFDEQVWKNALIEEYSSDPDGLKVDSNWVYCGEFEHPGEEQPQTITIKNKRGEGKINVTGRVWEDVDAQTKEGNKKDGLFTSIDKPLSGIDVQFMDDAGNPIAHGKTGSDGSYIIQDVEVKLSVLNKCFIRLNGYDSSLQPVTVQLDKTNGSKAAKQSSNSATTKDAHANLSDYYNEETQTVENINLGLAKPYIPNSGIASQNIEYVKIVRDGYTFTYRYGSSGGSGGSFQFQTSGRSFTQKLSPADISYSETTKGEKLAVYIVYGISVTNPETRRIPEEYWELYLHINRLTNTFDSSRLELSTDTSVAEDYVRYDIGQWSGGGGSATYYQPPKCSAIDPGATSEKTYIQLKLTPAALHEIVEKKLNQRSDLAEYSSTSEGYGYHHYKVLEPVWIEDPTPPDAEDEGPTGHYELQFVEHDTDEKKVSAGGFYINFELLDKTRTISGNIFEDNNTRGPNEVVGDGSRVNDEKGVSGVKVALIDAESNNVTNLHIWEQNGSSWQAKEIPAIVDVQDNGSYSLEGVVPGKYYLQFTYGNGKVKITDLNGNSIDAGEVQTSISGENIDVNNYKSTIVTSGVKSAFDGENNSSTNKSWILNAKNRNWSVAIDKTSNNDEGTVNDKETIPTRMETRTINKEDEDLTDIRTINAKSPKFEVLFEWSTQTSMDRESADAIDKECGGINFGIIKRPYTELQLTKNITNLKITLANGTTIVNWTPGSLPEQEPYVAALGKKDNYKESHENIKTDADREKSYLKAEMDELNIYGSTLEIRYEVSVTNLSQIDYAEENYYKYGTHENEAVKTVASTMIDYLPTGFNVEFKRDQNDTNNKSEELKDEDYKEFVLDEVVNEWKDEDYKKYKTTSEKQLETQIEKEEDEDLEKEKCLVYEYILTKQLTPQEEDMDYNSATEIAEVTNSTFTKRTKEMYQYTPGNYDGTKITKINDLDSKDERDNDYARVSIIKATGADQSAIMYITLGISMIVLATGIILIKKFVLDKK